MPTVQSCPSPLGRQNHKCAATILYAERNRSEEGLARVVSAFPDHLHLLRPATTTESRTDPVYEQHPSDTPHTCSPPHFGIASVRICIKKWQRNIFTGVLPPDPAYPSAQRGTMSVESRSPRYYRYVDRGSHPWGSWHFDNSALHVRRTGRLFR